MLLSTSEKCSLIIRHGSHVFILCLRRRIARKVAVMSFKFLNCFNCLCIATLHLSNDITPCHKIYVFSQILTVRVMWYQISWVLGLCDNVSCLWDVTLPPIHYLSMNKNYTQVNNAITHDLMWFFHIVSFIFMQWK